MKAITRRLGLAASGFLLLLGVGSASANPIPFFYLVPTGPTTVPTVVPVGDSTSTYQLWVDPSDATPSPFPPPGCFQPIAGQCNGDYGIFDNVVLATGSLTMTNFTAAPGTQTNFTVPDLVSGSELKFFTGDQTNGNATAFEVGTLTVARVGGAPGDVTLWSSDFLDTNFVKQNATVPQVLAIATPAPEPSTLLLLGAGLGGLVAVRARRQRV